MNVIYSRLEDLISALTINSNVHISIHDISGILDNNILNLNMKNRIHLTDFCTAAKTTDRGLNLCLACKKLANEKAIKEQKTFYGYCPNGLLEIATPVCINGKTVCIIYIGNMTLDINYTEMKLTKSCNITGVSKDRLIQFINNIEKIDSVDDYVKMSHIIESYICLIYNALEKSNKSTKSDYHWAVALFKNYVEVHFSNNVSLKKLSYLYYINEKYIGRLFKKQVGSSFHEYLNSLRLKNAENQLMNTNDKILKIAIDSGFQNVTYFNRMFIKKHGISPTKYREKNN